jgi:hypothetical protein
MPESNMDEKSLDTTWGTNHREKKNSARSNWERKGGQKLYGYQSFCWPPRKSLQNVFSGILCS